MPITNKNFYSCGDCEISSPLFNILNAKELQQFEGNKTTVIFKKGELIQKTGISISHITFLRKGFAKLYSENEKGNNLIVKILKPCEMFIPPGIFLDHRFHFSLKALTDCEICFIEQDTIEDLFRANGEFFKAYNTDLNTLLLEVIKKLSGIVWKKNSGKLAESLIFLNEKIFCQERRHLLLTTKEIADFSGVNVESTKKILKSFKDLGFIDYKQNYLDIINRSKLEEISING